MPRFRPTKPPGEKSMLHALMAEAWEYLWNGQFPFQDTETVRWRRSPTGYAAEVLAPGAAGKAAPGISSPRKTYAIKTLGSTLSPAIPDLLICSTCTIAADGTVSIGSDTVYIAKRRRMRRGVVKEYFYDNGNPATQTYTYFGPTVNDPSYGDNFRLAADGTQSETEVVDPRYITRDMLIGAPLPVQPLSLEQCLIEAEDIGSATGVKDPAGNSVTKLEVSERVWSKQVTA